MDKLDQLMAEILAGEPGPEVLWQIPPDAEVAFGDNPECLLDGTSFSFWVR